MKYLLGLLILLCASTSFAQERRLSIEFSSPIFGTSWTGNNRVTYTWGDDAQVYEEVKPVVGLGLSAALWHDTNPWLNLGLRYVSGRHIPLFYPSSSGINFMSTDKTESWQLAARFLTRSEKEKRGSGLFLIGGLDYTRTGWQVINANLWGEDVPDETLIKAKARIGQWSVVTGAGILLGRRAGFHLTLEYLYGVPLYSNNDDRFNLNMFSLMLGF